MSSIKWEAVPRFYDPLKAGSIDGTDSIPHDHGIVRAMQADYKPNRLVVGDPKATIFVGRLNPKTNESTLKKYFSRYGKIRRFRLVRDVVTGFSKGYAFIEYYDKHDALEAQRDYDEQRDYDPPIIDNKEIFVDAECERVLPGWVPRRLGGGLSGKKESGQLRFGGRERPFKRPIVPIQIGERSKDSNRHSYKDKYIPRERSDHHSSSKKSKY